VQLFHPIVVVEHISWSKLFEEFGPSMIQKGLSSFEKTMVPVFQLF
jgi:hypothetical protein